jgi:hypothetical protein
MERITTAINNVFGLNENRISTETPASQTGSSDRVNPLVWILLVLILLIAFPKMAGGSNGANPLKSLSKGI